MAAVEAAAIQRMTSSLYIERPWNSRSSTRFWVLLALASIIATAGVVADSTATVIGAMIVAPLMTPILGSALALVLADRTRLLHNVLLVLVGAVAVVLIAYLIGFTAAPADAFAGNSQVSSRISPKLIDLLAALATGTVGAFAMVRLDISDVIPGVAIAISLVPPLTVTGLLVNVGRYHDAAESALLFGTNVAAIIATGTMVFLLHGVRSAAAAAGYDVGQLRGLTLGVVCLLVLMVAIPLTIGSVSVASDERLAEKVKPLAIQWAQAAQWQILSVEARNGVVAVTALGPPPDLDPQALRQAMNNAGLAETDLRLHLIGGSTLLCSATQQNCVIVTGG